METAKNNGSLENSKWPIWKKKVSEFDQPLFRANLTADQRLIDQKGGQPDGVSHVF
jgi:hypothetical protein